MEIAKKRQQLPLVFQVQLMTIFKKRMAQCEEDEYSKFVCYTLEACSKIMDEEVASWTWLLNLKGRECCWLHGTGMCC